MQNRFSVDMGFAPSITGSITALSSIDLTVQNVRIGSWLYNLRLGTVLFGLGEQIQIADPANTTRRIGENLPSGDRISSITSDYYVFGEKTIDQGMRQINGISANATVNSNTIAWSFPNLGNVSRISSSLDAEFKKLTPSGPNNTFNFTTFRYNGYNSVLKQDFYDYVVAGSFRRNDLISASAPLTNTGNLAVFTPCQNSQMNVSWAGEPAGDFDAGDVGPTLSINSVTMGIPYDNVTNYAWGRVSSTGNYVPLQGQTTNSYIVDTKLAAASVLTKFNAAIVCVN
jgi:hypothetical protein